MRASLSLMGWVFVLVVGLSCGDASGLIIYRFGGGSLPPPPEADSEDVEYIQRPWPELDAALGGSTFQLDMDANSIKALEHDPDVNIAPGYEVREDGKVIGLINATAFDGDPNSIWFSERYICREMRGIGHMGSCHGDYAQPGSANLIFGGEFLITRIRIISGLNDPTLIARNIRVHLNSEIPRHQQYRLQPIIDGRYGLEGGLTLEVRDNREQILDIPIPPTEKAAFLQLIVSEHRGTLEIHEIEVFAEGFVDQSTYVSDTIDFGANAAWGELRWSGFKETGAKAFIQTRSGADDDPDLYWQVTGRGDEKVEVSQDQYNKIKLGERAGTTYDRDSWTFWSAPYDFADSSGAAVVSLSPRRYLQFKVDFIPQSNGGSGLDFLEVRASIPPVASTLIGEISPTQVEVGKLAQFTYALRSIIQGDDTGFDRLELSTSSIVNAVGAVRLDGVEVETQTEALDEHGFTVSLPRFDKNSSGALLEVDFEARALRYGASFDVRVADSSRPLEVPQGIQAGDATSEFEGNTVSVATSEGAGALLEVEVLPGAFTPNGDGINDAVRISYDLFETTGLIPVKIEIRDLAGRLVRTVYSGDHVIGHYEREWDGRDAARQLVPPGVYLYRVSISTDRQESEKLGTVNVAY